MDKDINAHQLLHIVSVGWPTIFQARIWNAQINMTAWSCSMGLRQSVLDPLAMFQYKDAAISIYGQPYVTTDIW